MEESARPSPRPDEREPVIVDAAVAPAPAFLHRLLPVSRSTSAGSIVAYLLSCLTSIALLVYVNASQVFVITDLLGRTGPNGNDVGTLGFADELLSIVMSPIWGALSDKIGTRVVSAAGYLISSFALVRFVHAKTVYPDLLLSRLIFATGASASIAMVTATLPHISAYADNNFNTGSAQQLAYQESKNNGQLAGLVGFCSCLGALLALGLLLPLPRYLVQWFEVMPLADALKYSFYLVAGFASTTGIVIFFFGNRERHKSFGRLFRGRRNRSISGDLPNEVVREMLVVHDRRSYFQLLKDGFLAGRDSRLALAYLTGIVARGASVVISLFIPTLVNFYFVKNGLCRVDPHAPSNEIKTGCREAYSLSASISGASQLITLLGAPMFGYLCDKLDRRILLIVSGTAGIVGFTGFTFVAENPLRKDIYIWALFIGLGQIGCVVTSLALCTGPYIDRNIRGSVAGTYSLTGGFGVLFVTKTGGYLFDAVGPWSPFALMAGMNAFLVLACLLACMTQYIHHSYQSQRAVQNGESILGEDEQWDEEREGLLARIHIQ